MLITSIEPPHHFMQHILNSRHTSSTIPRSNFTILRRNIGSIPVVSITIVTLVEVVVAIAVSISDIMTLTIVVTIVPTLVPLTLVPILLIRALGTWSETPHLFVYCIGILLIITLIVWRWWFSQIVDCIYLFCTLVTCFSTNPSSVLI